MSQVKEYIELSEKQYYVIKRIAEVYGQTVNEFIKEALNRAVITHLENPLELGLEFCKVLKKTFEMEEEQDKGKEVQE